MMSPRSTVNTPSTELEQLVQNFNRLCSSPNNKPSQTSIEKQKTRLMRLTLQALSHAIKEANHTTQKTIQTQRSNPQSYLSKFAREAYYLFLASFAMLQYISGQYIFGSTLIGLIPGINATGILITSIFYVALNAILYYAFELSSVREALDIPTSPSQIEELISTYREQIKLVAAINTHLSKIDALKLKKENYQAFWIFAQTLNQTLRAKLESISDYQPSLVKKCLKFFILTVGGISAIASSYFWTNEILIAFTASLVGTPIGWSIIGLSTLAALGYYFFKDGLNVSELIAPGYDKFRLMTKEFNRFSNDDSNDLNRISRLRTPYEVDKDTRCIETQTDEPVPTHHASGIEFFPPSSAPNAPTPYPAQPNASALFAIKQ
jgi:hypothetical protein